MNEEQHNENEVLGSILTIEKIVAKEQFTDNLV